MALPGMTNGFPTSLPGIAPAKEAGGASGLNFQEMVLKGMGSVNQEMNKAGQVSQEFLTGGKHDLHEVMIALDQADLSFRYMTQVRNKVLDAYSEMMRMQV